MGEHGSPMIIVSESCRTHLRGRGRGEGAIDHRAYDITEFANHSPVFHPLERSKTRLSPFVAVFVPRSRTAHPCKKKKRSKKEKLDARVLWMLLASDRGNEFPATKIISFDRPELAIISPPSNIFTSLFSFLSSRLRRGMECVWKRAEVVVGQFLKRWLSL